MPLLKISVKNNWNWRTGKQLVKNKISDMDNKKSMHRVFKSLCLFGLSQLIILLILNFIPLGSDCEWASVCRKWIESIIGLN